MWYYQQLFDKMESSSTARSDVKRVVTKEGHHNISDETDLNVKRRFFHFEPSNILEINWFFLLVAFIVTFLIIYAICGALFLIPDYIHEYSLEERCYHGVATYFEAFIFAFETGQTIGFGNRHITETCPDGFLFLSFCIFLCTFVTAVFSSIILGKVFRFIGTKRFEDIYFSRNAVIAMRNGSMFLMFRVVDTRPTPMDFGANISAVFLTYGKDEDQYGAESQDPNFFHVDEMRFGYQLSGMKSFTPMTWPIVLSHKIDALSPLYTFRPEDLLLKKFEILVTMSGKTETGSVLKQVTSYTNEEVVWGARFLPETAIFEEDDVTVVSFAEEDIDPYEFDEKATPNMSAKDIEFCPDF